MERQLPWSIESSYAGARGAVALWEQIHWLHWSKWSSGFHGAQKEGLSMLEHVEQWLSGSRYSGSTGANGAAASLEHRKKEVCWSTWSRGSLGADTVPTLENMEQHLSGSRFSISTVACVPAEMLCVLRESSCSKKYLYLLPESRCSICYSIAALCAPRKPLLQLLQWSTCICS